MQTDVVTLCDLTRYTAKYINRAMSVFIYMKGIKESYKKMIASQGPGQLIIHIHTLSLFALWLLMFNFRKCLLMFGFA